MGQQRGRYLVEHGPAASGTRRFDETPDEFLHGAMVADRIEQRDPGAALPYHT